MAEIQNWLDEELKTTGSPSPYKKLPALKLVPNKVVELEIDFSKPFYKWEDKIYKSIKAIIPCKLNGENLNFWINTKNLVYRQICEKGKAGVNKIKIIQTGTQANTKYNLVE